MKRFLKICAILCLVMVIAGLSVQGQILHPVKWSYGAKRLSKTEAVVFLKATIEDGWHIYSAYQKEGGPVPTSFKFECPLSGKLAEPPPETRHEESFGMDVSYFERSAVFQQRVGLSLSKPDIQGSLTFMVCNDQKCLPPETVTFHIKIPPQ